MKLSNYLTKDGKLTHMLKLGDTQGGIAGFTGTARIIEPSGEWRTERIPPDEPPIPGRAAYRKSVSSLGPPAGRAGFAQFAQRTGGATTG
jgi:hypothetical protein